MITPELTKDADKMICIIYKMYLEKSSLECQR